MTGEVSEKLISTFFHIGGSNDLIAAPAYKSCFVLFC